MPIPNADLSNPNELPNYGLCNVPGITHSHGMICLQCDLAKLLLDSMPPEPDLMDIIERAFLGGQIDSLEAGLAYHLISQMSAFSTRDIN